MPTYKELGLFCGGTRHCASKISPFHGRQGCVFLRQKRGETNPRTGMGEKRGQGLVFEPGNLASGVARVTLTPKEGEGGICVMYACINDTYACTYANYATGIFLLRTFIQHDVRTVNCVPY